MLMSNNAPVVFDTIVVGAGSAGCVSRAACRRVGRTVLLLEAGIDTPPGKEPADILDIYPASYYNKSHMWPRVKSHWRHRDNSPAGGFHQARIIGGGSTVMGMVALRGTPDDYDEWKHRAPAGPGRMSCPGSAGSRPTSTSMGTARQGRPYPDPPRRRRKWTPLARAAHAFAASRQMAIRRHERRLSRRLSRAADEQFAEMRASAALCYLDADVRARQNLTPEQATASEIMFDGRRAVGVKATVAGEARHYVAREIILCGRRHPVPTLLLRSGIGPAAALRSLGIAMRADLPGVGQNLQNHPVLFIGAHLRAEARQPAGSTHPAGD